MVFRKGVYPKPLQNLIELFTQFPGIGPRQAARFAFFILDPVRSKKPSASAGAQEAHRTSNGVEEDASLRHELISALQALEDVGFCFQCFRATEKKNGGLCTICKDAKRDSFTIAVVEKESDLQNIEKSGAYHGLYHILGGVISPLDAESPKRLHLKDLHGRIKKILDEEGNCEVVLATNTTTEGDTTALYIERILSPLKEQHPTLKISRLGRGLSLGTELEYADEITVKNALTNRR